MIRPLSKIASGCALILGCSGGLVEVENGTGGVSASISAATLGDECANNAPGAPSPATGAGAASKSAGDCAPSLAGGCGGPPLCRGSNVQLLFTIDGDSTAPVPVKITKVTLHDEKTRAQLDTLTTSLPTIWQTGNSSAYVAWDEVVDGDLPMKTSYTMSSPKWSSIYSSGVSRYSSTQTYYLEVTIRAGGKEFTIRSGALSREPEIAT